MKKNIFLSLLLFIIFSDIANGTIATGIVTTTGGFCNSPEWYQDIRPINIISLLVILFLFLSFYLRTDYLSNIRIKNNFFKIITMIGLIIILNYIIIHIATFLYLN